jgi:predicted ABC-type ATPase
MGGAGSGKNWMIRHSKILSTYTLVDVDEMKKEVGLDVAIKGVKPALEAAFKRKENVAHPTTGSHLKGQQNKIQLAKDNGYKVVLYLIDTNPDLAAKRVADRVAKGGHDVKPEAIAASNAKARENFNLLKPLADNAITL